MSDKINPPTDLNSFLAGVGHICLQWALLEQLIIALIAAAEDMPLEKTYTRFGRLDMLERVKMAIKLAVEARWPGRLIGRLRGIQRSLQKGGDALAERRNLFVHGVHCGTPTPGEFELTMVRWPANQRSEIVTISDAYLLANRLAQLAKEAESIYAAYGAWKFKAEDNTNASEHIAQSKANARLARAHNIKRAIKLLWANLKG